ncbi:hypothetical protein K431DRAFT_227830 [Polychaeton citri CBS 116435]|uniref:Uncharacterized protein n=1 Tax=Polychaeton citri CBS 116435 TaxID=1314669 RepID=A0A9P4UNV6_9PEZI|nr:hypothetical protein K431DRAFT_227830 [Polychaeton citri CBS 116435]
MPGAYPTSYPVYNPTAAGGPQHVYGNNANGQKPAFLPGTWLDDARRMASNSYQTARNAFPGDQLDHLRQLITGSMHSRERASLQHRGEDDDMQIVGSRMIHNPYANHQDLWQQRYDTIASYDPEKTKEEIENLLDNIRPDEDLPDDLLVRTPEEMNVRLHKYQELGLTWLKACEEGNSKGGILADDMGLGKTIQMLSLMVSHKAERDSANKTTLIVAPVALMRQWKQEIADRIKNRHRLSVFIHHGATKKKTHHELMSYDVVITTYGSLASELKKLESLQRRRITNPDSRPLPRETCVLINTDRPWYRVILDEAQCIKNRNTQSSRAACHLNAVHRFCCTGTPMMNNVDELYSLIKFLRIKPYCVWENFRTDFALPLKSQDERQRSKAMRKLQTVCKAIMLRRTKSSKHEGRPILILPERTTDEVRPEFSQDESDFYSALDQKTQLQFNKYLRKGEVGTNYSAILVLLLRLRQACCHPHLIKDFGVQGVAGVTEDQLLEKAKQLPEEVVLRIKEAGDSFECAICCDAHPNPAIFVPCGHSSCHDCFSRIVDAANRNDGNEGNETRCHFCRSPVDPKSITDFFTFKKVHWREKLSPEELAGDEEDEEEDDSDTDSDEEGEDGNEDETLDGFIVKDDVEDESETEVGDSDGDLNIKEPVKREAIKDEPTSGGPTVKDEHDPAEDLGGSVRDAQLTLFSDITPSASKGKGKSKEAVATPKKPKKSRKAKGKQKKSANLTLAELKKMGERNMMARKKYLKRLRKNWISSAKIDQTMELLHNIMDSKEGEKVLIFSQWTSLLDLLEVPVDREGFSYRRYDGSMNPRARGDAVDDFRDPQKGVRIMLISLKAGNAGLNLNMASQVIILDPFWNPYIEEQAIDRAHRLGQQRPVKVNRVLIKDTVEDRILQLQEQKRALISEALDEKASQSIGRLGVQELAYLFGVTSDPSQRVNYRPRERR